MLSFSGRIVITFARRISEGMINEIAVTIPNNIITLIKASFIKRTRKCLFPPKHFGGEYVNKDAPAQEN